MTDIANELNAQSATSNVFAQIQQSALELNSAKAIGSFTLWTMKNGNLLNDLGINLTGAYNIGNQAPNLPIVDSTPAIFDAAGPVSNLTYTNTNNVLNIFLGAAANDGASKAASIVITPGTYASVADLVTELQTQSMRLSGQQDHGLRLRRRTLRSSSRHWQRGRCRRSCGWRESHGTPDTASDDADLNLVALAGNVPATMAQTAGVNGNDKFIINLGPSASKTGSAIPPQTIDLRAGSITSVNDLVNEINYQIFQNDQLRGQVTCTLDNGRIRLETVKQGSDVKASDFQISGRRYRNASSAWNFRCPATSRDRRCSPVIPVYRRGRIERHGNGRSRPERKSRRHRPGQRSLLKSPRASITTSRVYAMN